MLYLGLTSLMKDIKRTYQYHGAEHKTIACHESGEELNVDNVKSKAGSTQGVGLVLSSLCLLLVYLYSAF